MDGLHRSQETWLDYLPPTLKLSAAGYPHLGRRNGFDGLLGKLGLVLWRP